MNIQNKFKKTNTIYKITKDMDLEGSTLIIPVGCTLDFQGGSFKNGTINFNDTILSGDIKIKTRLTGSVKNNEISVLWFNVVGDGITDDRLAIQDVFDITPANSTVIFPRVSGFYKVIIGTGKGSTIIAQRADALANDTLYPIKISKDSVTVIVRGIIKSTTILGNMFELQGNSIVFIGEGGKLQGPGGEDTIGFLDANTSDTTLQWHPSLLKVNGDNCNVSSLSFEDYPTHGIDCYGKALIVDSCLFIGGRVAHSTTGGTVLMGIRTNVGADSVIIKNNRFIANSKGGKCYSCVFPSGDNFIISNNICEKYHEHAVYAYGNYGSIIDNKFTDVNCIASDIQYFATYGSIKGNYSIGTEGFVQIMHGKGTIIEGNTVTNCRGGIIVRPYHTVDVDRLPSGLKLLNNYIELTAGTTGSCLSFYVLGTYDISDILISGNTFANGYYTQTSQVAASLLIGAGSSENNGIKFLRVENNVIRSGRGAVSWLKGIHNSIFKNNKFISETIDGVTSAFSSAINANYVTDTIFEGNEFIDLKETPTMARIIQLNTGTSNLTVSDNNIINYTSNIYLDYDTDAKIIYKNNNRRNYLSLAGSYDNKPNAYAQEYGVNYYDKDHQIPIWWSGVRWKDSLGSYIVLSKSDINTPNKLYRILFDIDLNGETLTLPANCTLDFQGGSISNGTIIGSNTTVLPNGYKIQNVSLEGSFKYPDGVNAVSSDGLCLNNVYDILDKQNLATTEVNYYVVKDDDYTILSQFDTLKNVNAVDGSFIGFPTSVIYNNLLYCFYYKANTHESTPGIQENIYYKYSSDKGITWSEEKEWVLPSSDSNGTYRSYRTAYVVPFGSNLLFGIFCTTTTSSAIGGSFTLVCEATISEAHDITILNQIKTPIVGASGSLVYNYTDATITNSMIIGGNIIQVGSNYLMACYTSNRNNYVFSFDGNFTDNTHITQLDVISSEQFDYTEHAFIKFSDTNFYIAFREDARRENTPIFKYDTSTSKFELFTYIDNVAYDGLDAIILDDNTAMIAGRDARNQFTPTRFALMNSSGKVFISNAKYYGDVLGRDCGYCSLQIIEDILINIFYLKRSLPNYNYGVVSRRIPVKTLTNLIFY